MTSTHRVYSGIQPTGSIHLGNYLGSIKQWSKMQTEYSCIFAVMDLHALTARVDPNQLREHIFQTAALVIASGIDPSKVVFYQQSTLHQHAELSWILSNLAPVSHLERMTQWKDKGEQHNHLGMFSYPVLMAADILLFKTTHVPVGDDQKQHLELARYLAKAFNRHYNCYQFAIPKPIISEDSGRIMSLYDPTKKMSKSDPSDYTRINLLDTPDEIALKIKKATSDSLTYISYEPETRPALANLIRIYSAIKDQTTEQTTAEFSGLNFSAFKTRLSELLIDYLVKIQKNYYEIHKDRTVITKLLAYGSEYASDLAESTMSDVKKIIGVTL